ncbi:tight adherence protein C [Ectothiorhodosinus mongolicus]|uniref:Tight adherence protein C n=1 Tax=Ectothiorhodosinus mongolicus TaxID=233100 RepID=A0A1R3VM26_9GAMM|nr:type II secretion system F family protein [Ectothiorhodosinus mongolicus]ULX57775.1 hypothetical protein CKX93_09010 [Ectothiorhodosinus mongolicus]SIT65638.1 tight adherence protein C [Ectothiorhodosinus mongolicus]
MPTQTMFLHWGALAAVFIAASLLVFAVLSLVLARGGATQRRLQSLQMGYDPKATAPPIRKDTPQILGSFLVRWVEPAGKILLPREDWQKSRLQTRLVQAGYRGYRGLKVFLGSKILLAISLPLVGFLLGMATSPRLVYDWQFLTLLMLLAVVGFYAPDLVLRQKITTRRRELENSFPDAMDMLVVCVEAGLGLDSAIERVGGEMMFSHPQLAAEFRLMALELRAGKTREEALRSLAQRCGIPQIKSLTGILIQAERYGTSIGDALREFARGMRIERIQRARERAAKLPVKMVFPILLLIFPALFLVLLGPAVIQIFTVLFA